MAADLAGSGGGGGGGRPVTLWGHAEFLRAHASAEDLAQTTTRTGYNPMLQEYGNMRWLVAG
jgi:hypothetical protein